MDANELSQFLRTSLADHKLSGGERSALADWLAANVGTEQDRGLARHVAFEVAKGEVSDPKTAQIIDWLEAVMKAIVPNVPDATAADSEARAYFSPGERCLQQVIHRFGECRHSADVCVFTITDDRISRAILDAHHRGVKVRIISDHDKAGDLGSDILQFRAVGMSVKLADVHGRTDRHVNGHMHNKFAIFDGTHLVNGSYNWTRGAADTNFENIVDSTDARLIEAFAEEFKRLWNRF